MKTNYDSALQTPCSNVFTKNAQGIHSTPNTNHAVPFDNSTLKTKGCGVAFLEGGQLNNFYNRVEWWGSAELHL